MHAHLEDRLARAFRIRVGQLTVIEDGEETVFGAGALLERGVPSIDVERDARCSDDVALVKISTAIPRRAMRSAVCTT